MPTAPPIRAVAGTRRVVALVGPTGVGKTTTVAKLAANFKLAHGFRPGLVTEPMMLAFDAPGEWLVAVGVQGLLHSVALDGSPPDVLPRAFHLSLSC